MTNEVNTYLRLGATSRRHFLRATAIAGSLAAATSLAPSTIAGLALGRAAAQGVSALEVLNYALTLEHLENALYRDLIASGILTGTALQYAQVFGAHESEHVNLLTNTIQQLGGTPVQEQQAYNWPQLSSEAEVLNLLANVEDLGASAYLGAAPLLEDDNLLTVAVQIHTNEAWHATGFRVLAGYAEPLGSAFAEPKSMQQVLQEVAPFLMPAQMPDTGLTDGDGLKMVGIAGGLAAAAAGIALARGQNEQTPESEA